MGDFFGYQWLPMVTNGYQWLPMVTNGFQYLPWTFRERGRGHANVSVLCRANSVVHGCRFVLRRPWTTMGNRAEKPQASNSKLQGKSNHQTPKRGIAFEF